MANDPTIKTTRNKLTTLASSYGFPSINTMLEAVIFDSTAPAICMNEDCSYTTDMEPDQDHGFCEMCNTQTVKSALLLADFTL